MHLLYLGILWPVVVLFTLTCYISIIFSRINLFTRGDGEDSFLYGCDYPVTILPVELREFLQGP